MQDVIELLPPRWTDERAKLTYEMLQGRRAEVIRQFTISAEVLGVVIPEQLADAERRLHLMIEDLSLKMADLYGRHTSPQAHISHLKD